MLLSNPDIVELVKKVESGHYGIKLGDAAPKFATPEIPILFTCPGCRVTYDTQEQAENCRDQPYDIAGWSVGDLVLIPGKRLYHKAARPEWIAFRQPADPESLSHFNHRDTYHPWWVITHIGPQDRNPHRPVATVCSLAKGQLYPGWNPANGDGHHAMYRPGVPEMEQRAAGESCWWERVGNLIFGANPPEVVIQEAEQLAAIGISTGTLL